MSKAASAGQGALAGAGTGAAIGSAFTPVGTAIGAAAGGVAGGAWGWLTGKDDELSDDQKKQMALQQQQQQTLFDEQQGAINNIQDPNGQYGQSLGLMKSAAMGNAPSQAQIMMNNGIEQTMGGAYGMAAGNNGISPALALRHAMMSAGQTALQGVSQSAALRAAEMSSSRNSYMQALQNQQQLIASITGGQAGNAANMAGIASGSATSLALPGVQTGAQTNQMLLGGGINALGSIGANWAKNNGQNGTPAGGFWNPNQLNASENNFTSNAGLNAAYPGAPVNKDWSQGIIPQGGGDFNSGSNNVA